MRMLRRRSSFVIALPPLPDRETAPGRRDSGVAPQSRRAVAGSRVMVGAHQPITTRGRLRTASEMRSRIATMSQFATSDEPPAARNGVVRPVSGMMRVTPPTMMNTCSAIVNDRPVAEQLAEVVLAGQADADAAAREDHVKAEDREDADESELLAEARQDVVALREGRDVRPALAEAGADDPALREPEDALDELVAAAAALDHLGVEGVEPVREAPADVRQDARREERAGGGEHDSEQHPARLAGRDVEHRDEHPEDQQAGAEVALQHDDPERDQPDHQQRAEFACPRPRHAEEARSDRAEALARSDEIPREEDREGDLGELTGLEREEAQRDPDVGVGIGSQAGNDRQHEQHDAGQARDVRVAEQHAVVAQQHHDRDRAADRDARPRDLLRRVRVPALEFHGDVDAVDHRDARGPSARWRSAARRGRHPAPGSEDDVQGEDEGGQPAAVEQEGHIDRAQRSELDQSDRRCVDHEREEQQEQLAVALRLRHADASAARAGRRCRR